MITARPAEPHSPPVTCRWTAARRHEVGALPVRLDLTPRAGGTIQSRTLSGEACGGRVHMPTRCSSSGHTSRRKAAKRATRARRERARGAARSGAPEQWRPDQCTTRRASASVAGATTTDRWHRSNTLPPARAAQLHREAHRKLSEQTPGFERDERVEGKRTAASRVREEVCRHVDLPSPSVVILLATAAPRCGCGASIMVGT